MSDLAIAICPHCGAIPAACTVHPDYYDDIGEIFAFYAPRGYAIEMRGSLTDGAIVLGKCECESNPTAAIPVREGGRRATGLFSRLWILARGG